jgi:hypothetical protein
VPYYIAWEDLTPGGSFFIKTTAHVSEVRTELLPVIEYFGVNLKAVQRHEFGYYGVRVWRLA